MTQSYLSLDHIKPALAQGGVVLVPNNRLRNHLQRAYALQLNEPAWEKPRIYSLSEWLATLWRQLQHQAYEPACVKIASRLQLQILWEKVITRSPVGAGLLRPQALAEQADSARQTLELWQIGDAELESYLPSLTNQRSSASDGGIQNYALFHQWLILFREELKKSGAVTRETSFDQIARALHEKVLFQSSAIFLEGFDELPPLIIKVLESTGAQIIHLPDQARTNPVIQRTQVANTEDEIRAAALWSQALLIENQTQIQSQLEINPSLMDAPLIGPPLIGIVVPNLGQSREKIERIFTEVFEPQSLLPQVPRYTLPFNFSAGVPLGSTPIIQSFFSILNLRQKEIALDSICDLLSSPFWSIEISENFSQESLDKHQNYLSRIETITELRKLQHLHINLSDIVYCANKAEKKLNEAEQKISSLFETLNNFIREKKTNSQSSGAWLNYFDQLVTHLNWPGERRLDSQEFQQLNQFQEVRNQFVQIDLMLSASQAITYLRYLVDRTPFQAQTPDSPIQILGALEAAGLQFSHLWVMGLSDDQWPAPASPNPLLPMHLQTHHKMPHANAARELDIAQQLTTRYKKTADHIIFSNAVHNLESKSDAELVLRPSALIRDILPTPIASIVEKIESPLQNFYQQVFAHKNLEIIQDSTGPQLDTSEKIRGGARLLEDQANCPLIAFARWRLGAENPKEPEYGFSSMERGNLLHECLAGIWRQLKNSSQLLDISENHLNELIVEHATTAVKRLQNRNPRHIGNKYVELEIQRLTQLINEWLEIERGRPAFTVIAIEEEREIIFDKLALKLRLDRIDEFNNGEQIIVDYKTGSVNLKQVLDARLTQPQLALYALAEQKNSVNKIAAVAFAKIARGDQKYLGMGQLTGDAINQPGIQIADDWNQQLITWRESLTLLAQEFCAGVADQTFYSKDAEKYSADLKPFLRNFDEDLYES